MADIIDDAVPIDGAAPDAAPRALHEAARKACRRLMPFLILMYMLAFLDRANVGVAKQALFAQAHIPNAMFALGAGIFFVGYALFEVLSNLILHRVGARVWLARIMITWGIVAACTMFVEGGTSFAAVRFLLGLTEAVFFPGVILYLTDWFHRNIAAACAGRTTALSRQASSRMRHVAVLSQRRR